MRTSYLSVMAVLLSVVGAAALSACGSDAPSEKQAQGSVSVALTGVSASGVTYRLRTGNFVITGPKNVNFSTETSPDATTRSFELPAGSYLIRLQTGWTMERFNGMGFETVEAILLSANPAGFSIVDQQHTGVVFRFRAGDDVIQLGNGVLDVSVSIDDDMSSCPMGQMRCAGVCVNSSSDSNNCGTCGNVCMPGFPCQNGMCVAMGCPMGLVQCGATCVDPNSDPNNCGGCGGICSVNATCQNGNCVGMDMGCPMPLVDCGGACVDLNGDPNNCGGCASVCPANHSCQNGTCVDMGCPMPLVQCGAACVDLVKNSDNCGACGNVCPMGFVCDLGMCVPQL